MKYFKTKKLKKTNKLFNIIICILLIDFFVLKVYIKRLSNSTTFLSKLKIEELTKFYLNNTIKKYVNLDTNDYIKTNLVNNNIVSVDIDNNESNKLLKNILEDLENNTIKLTQGDIKNYHNLEILTGEKNGGIIILVPYGVVFNNALFASLGPKIPVKISFLENIEAYVNVDVKNYGINNSLIKLYINIRIEEVIEMPMKKRTQNIEYKYLISSKLINGNVPSLYYDKVTSNSNLVK